MSYALSYVAALATFFLVDMVWLSTMASRLYRPTLGDILLTKVSIWPAVFFYVLYPIGLVVFAVNPAVKTGNVGTALVLGGLLGLFTYGTYDLTNQATLRNWTTRLTLADMAWGCVLGAVSAAVAYWCASRFGGPG